MVRRCLWMSVALVVGWGLLADLQVANAQSELAKVGTFLPGSTPQPLLTPDLITNSLGMTLKLIPAREFLMGSSDADVAADRAPPATDSCS